MKKEVKYIYDCNDNKIVEASKLPKGHSWRDDIGKKKIKAKEKIRDWRDNL